MFKNYIKIAWRNILKNKGIFSINIVGLALGIASCLIITLFVVDEVSYDKFNEKADEIVRVGFRVQMNNEDSKEAVVMAPAARTLKQDYPEVLDATRIARIGTPKVTYENTAFRDGKSAYVDPNFFDVFTLPIIKGNAVSPLQEPNTVVITEKESKKYFGNADPIGKILYLEGQERPFKITAVIEEVPRNSHFHFDLFASMEGYKLAESTSWVNSDFHTYLVLKKGYDYKNLEAKLPQTLKKYMGPQMQEALGVTFSEFTKENELGFILQPLTDIHLNSDFSPASTLEQGGDIKYVYIFSAIALFMLLIACINFMNLSTAAASKRAKEVGIRKVLGSDKKQLVKQFLIESVIATTVAIVLATILLLVSLPFFNTLSGKDLQVDYLLQPYLLVSLLGLTLLISLLAGGYPAFFLSSFKPIRALKNKFSVSGKTKGIRSGLVVFQFVISAGLILATLIVNQQMSYIQSKDLGYDKDQMLVLRESYLLGNDENAFKDQILNDSRVANVTHSAFVPAGNSDTNMSGIFMGKNFLRRMFVYNIDEQYIPTMGMELVKGRNFSKEFGTDSTNAIINESAAQVLGFGNEPLGKTFTRDTNDGGKKLTVIGVIEDFHFKSLHQAIEPLIMLNQPYGGLIVRAKVSEMSGLIADINSLWNNFNTKETFGYTLLDDAYNQTYVTEQKMGTVLNIFALLTILVACLGLFGLVTFTAEQRFKEIGIRKVLGSSVPQIMAMLSKDFLKLVCFAFFIAFPLGYYLMDKWLQSFAYRMEMQWWLFAMAALVTILIAFGTIGWKSFRAATMNPVKALRAE